MAIKFKFTDVSAMEKVFKRVAQKPDNYLKAVVFDGTIPLTESVINVSRILHSDTGQMANAVHQSEMKARGGTVKAYVYSYGYRDDIRSNFPGGVPNPLVMSVQNSRDHFIDNVISAARGDVLEAMQNKMDQIIDGINAEVE